MLPKAAPLTARRGCAAVVGAVLSLTGSSARADDTSDCIAASEAAQSLRDEHALHAAREKLAVCSRDACPTPIRLDCLEQLAHVEAATPTVVLRARDAQGEDAPSVRVSCDGAPLAAELDGRAVAVDPGPHTLRFERAGAPGVERRIVVAEGEKNRLVVVDIGAVPSTEPAKSSEAQASPPPRTDAPPAASGSSTAGWIVGAAGVAATIPMAILWGSATGDISRMRTSCAPSAGGSGCPSSRVDADRTELIAGDALLGVAVVGVVTGAVLVFLRPGQPKPKEAERLGLRIGAAPMPGGAYVSAGARF